jgi:hypothetical protein
MSNSLVPIRADNLVFIMRRVLGWELVAGHYGPHPLGNVQRAGAERLAR